MNVFHALSTIAARLSCSSIHVLCTLVCVVGTITLNVTHESLVSPNPICWICYVIHKDMYLTQDPNRIFLNENIRISIKISLKFVPKGPINNNPALVQIMAWRRSGDKPLSEPMMISLLTHICVTRPQWVTQIFSTHRCAYWEKPNMVGLCIHILGRHVKGIIIILCCGHYLTVTCPPTILLILLVILNKIIKHWHHFIQSIFR